MVSLFYASVGGAAGERIVCFEEFVQIVFHAHLFTMADAPHVVIIGAGFGGLYAARTLARKRVRITVVDRKNHHVFQPLLYQVATAKLSPADIASPIRSILGKHRNAQVLLDEATEFDLANHKAKLKTGEALAYDYLVVAAGAS